MQEFFDPAAVLITGLVMRPTNRTYQDAGSIHNDATAQELGFRGGTIAAGTHFDQFPPLLLEAYGPRWWESGCLSMYFRYATTDGEPVQIAMERPSGSVEGARIVMATSERNPNQLVAEGTAGIESNHISALSVRDLRHDAVDLRILANLEIGQSIASAERTIAGDTQLQKLRDGLVVAPLPDYSKEESLALPSLIVNLFADAAGDALLPLIGTSVGLWGAIELRAHSGPMRVDTNYRISGQVVAMSDSPKTEQLWYDMSAHNEAGALILTSRILTRFVKASSPLYATP